MLRTKGQTGGHPRCAPVAREAQEPQAAATRNSALGSRDVGREAQDLRERRHLGLVPERPTSQLRRPQAALRLQGIAAVVAPGPLWHPTDSDTDLEIWSQRTRTFSTANRLCLCGLLHGLGTHDQVEAWRATHPRREFPRRRVPAPKARDSRLPTTRVSTTRVIAQWLWALLLSCFAHSTAHQRQAKAGTVRVRPQRRAQNKNEKPNKENFLYECTRVNSALTYTGESCMNVHG